MTHYAFATALMNLVLVPTNMISGPLAESLGFSTYFLVVMFASVPSAWAAFRAPFPARPTARPEALPEVTADDPSRLSPAERRVQRIAGPGVDLRDAERPDHPPGGRSDPRLPPG